MASVLGAMAMLLASPAAGQTPWEYSPYQIRVWLSVEHGGGLNGRIAEEIKSTLLRRAEANVGACWTVSVEPPPVELAGDMAVDVTLVTPDDVDAIDKKILLENDKLFLVRVTANPRENVVTVVEMDCRMRHFGPVVTHRVRQPDALAPATFDALLEAFAPMVRIEDGTDRNLITRLRAGGLITDKDSPAYIGVGDFLQPIIRKNNRLGVHTRIDVVVWTYLEVEDRNKINPNILNCYVHSAMRSPIRGRGGSRKIQYAFGLRKTHDSTMLNVVAQVRRNETAYPLPGIEVYSKRPSTDPLPETPEEKLAAAKKNPAVKLGETDWRGAIDILPYEMPVRIVYLKNGGQLLRRLPIVPGLDTQLISDVPDDDPRLQAESAIKGFHGQIKDLVAQRQMLAIRIKKRLQEGKVEEARELHAEFGKLETRSSMNDRLNKAQRQQVESPNKYVQGRIDDLYGDTRSMVAKYLRPELDSELLGLIVEAERKSAAGGGAEPVAAQPAPGSGGSGAAGPAGGSGSQAAAGGATPASGQANAGAPPNSGGTSAGAAGNGGVTSPPPGAPVGAAASGPGTTSTGPAANTANPGATSAPAGSASAPLSPP